MGRESGAVRKKAHEWKRKREESEDQPTDRSENACSV